MSMNQHFMKTANISYPLAALIMMMTAACTDNDAVLTDDNTDAPLYVSIVTRIGDPAESASTRYGGTDVNALSFQEGDKIGLFENQSEFSCWTRNATTWASNPVMYWENKTASHTFEAFYPYAEATSRTSVPVPTLTGQTGKISGLSDFDFMVATASCTYGSDGVVKFTGESSFKHKLCLLALTFKATADLKNATINSITLEAEGLTTAKTYSFATGQFTTSAAGTRSNSDDLLSSAPAQEMGTSDQTLYYIMNPTSDPIKMTLIFTKGETKYSSTVTFTQSTQTAGTEYISTITVSNGTISIGTSDTNISGWDKVESLGSFTTGSSNSNS